MKFPPLLLLVMLALLTFPLSGENLVHTELSVFNLVSFPRGGESTYSMAGAVDLSFDSAGYRNMKGGVSLVFADVSGNDTGMSLVTVKQLEIKARFPSLRLTTGLTRLDWGEGLLLNSANTLFADDAEQASFDMSSLELQRKWLLAVSSYLSPFSFIEATVVAPGDDDENPNTPVELARTSGGIRYYNGEHAAAWEAGVSLTQGTDRPLLSPHLALSGGALVEWYCALSTSFSFEQDTWETALEALSASAGIYQIFTYDSGATLTARLEGRLFPFREDTERFLLYPSLTYSLSNSASFTLQAIIAALDPSSSVSAGVSWNVFEGFTMSAFGTAELGGSGDTYSYEALTATLGFSTIF